MTARLMEWVLLCSIVFMGVALLAEPAAIIIQH